MQFKLFLLLSADLQQAYSSASLGYKLFQNWSECFKFQLKTVIITQGVLLVQSKITGFDIDFYCLLYVIQMGFVEERILEAKTDCYGKDRLFVNSFAFRVMTFEPIMI